MANLFQTFAYFVICIGILSCNSEKEDNPEVFYLGEKLKTLLGREIENEINAFKVYLEQISDKEIRAEFTGLLKAMAKRAIMADWLIETRGEMRRKVSYYIDKTMPLSCRKNLRYKMDRFGIEFGLIGGNRLMTSQVLTTALNHIKAAIRKRISTLHDVACTLKTLYGEYRAVTSCSEDANTEIWIGKFKTAYCLLKTVKIDLDAAKIIPEVTNITLTDLLMEIQATPDVQIATDVFRKQSVNGYWSRVKLDYLVENQEIRNLSTFLPEQEKRKIFEDYDKNKNNRKLEYQDREYLKDLLDFRSYFVSNNKRYESCTEVFYFAPSSRLDLMKEDLREQWPDLVDPARVHRFCESFSSLYDLVSIGDIHTLMDIPDNCIPDSNYFYKFLKKLLTSRTKYFLNDYIFVSKILGSMEYDFTPPTEKPA